LLAICIRPLGMEFAVLIQYLYPPSPDMEAQIGLLSDALNLVPNFWVLLLLMAVLPAVCEEFAFRGFILSGLRHVGHKWWAIGLSSVAFGMVHPILQQQIAAAAVGLVLGYLAVQTGSLLLCILFHAIYNGLGLAVSEMIGEAGKYSSESQLAWLLSGNEKVIFQPWVLILSAAGASAILWWLHRLPYQRTKEEKLQEAREQSLVSALES